MSKLLGLLLPLLLIAAYSCRTNAQSCAPLTDPTCSFIVPVGTMIYVPPGLTIGDLQVSSKNGINTLFFVNDIPEPCRSYLLQSMCGTYLRPCHIENGTAIPIPQQPCLDVCWRYYNNCAEGGFRTRRIIPGQGQYFPPGFQAPLNCSNPPIDITAGNSSFYPSTGVNQIIPYNGTNHSVPCSQGKAIGIPAHVYCQDPLVAAVTDTGKEVCAFSCPLPSLTDDQYESAKIMQGILGWTSWVLSALLIIVLLVNPTTRAFPRNLIIMTACAANIAAAAIILPTYAGYDNTWCGGSDTFLTPEIEGIVFDAATKLAKLQFKVDESSLSFESSLCTFQGAMLQFGFLAAVFWWTIIAFNMCFELYVGMAVSLVSPYWKWSRFGVYNVVGWGVPFVLMVIPAAAGRIKFAPAGTYCFVTGEDDNAWSLTFWFLPVGICMLVGVFLFICAMVRITILLIKLDKVKKLLLLYPRLLVFIFIYLVLFIFIFAYNIQYSANKSDIEQGYQDYYVCLILASSSGCGLSDSITNYDLVMLKAWAISSLGAILFFIFMSWDIMVFWYHLFKAIGKFFLRRTKADAWRVLHQFVESSHSSITAAGSDSLSVVSLGEVPEEQKEGDEEEEDETNSSSLESEEGL